MPGKKSASDVDVLVDGDVFDGDEVVLKEEGNGDAKEVKSGASGGKKRPVLFTEIVTELIVGNSGKMHDRVVIDSIMGLDARTVWEKVRSGVSVGGTVTIEPSVELRGEENALEWFKRVGDREYRRV